MATEAPEEITTTTPQMAESESAPGRRSARARLSALLSAARRWSATPGGRVWRDAAWVWLLTRALLLAITFLAPALLLQGAQAPGDALHHWVTQDATHFVYIARYGYTDYWRTAFWPLFPALMHALGPIFGGDYGLAGLVLANASFFIALVALRSLAERELGAAAARRAIIYLAIFPTAFYFFAPYSESLFLALSVGCFAALRQRRWALAGALGLCATLTRSTGLILAVPFAIEFALALRRRQARIWQGAWVALLPAGVALYSGFLLSEHRDPFAFFHAQAYWGRSLQWPWTTFTRAFSGLGAPQSGSGGFGGTHLLLNLLTLILFIGLTLLALRALPLSYGLYALALALYDSLFPAQDPVAAVQGEARLVLIIFPVFLALGLWGRRSWLHEALLLLAPPLLALACAHYLIAITR